MNVFQNELIVTEIDEDEYLHYPSMQYLAFKNGETERNPFLEGGFVVTWCGIAVKIYHNSRVTVIDENEEETVVGQIKYRENKCIYYQAGICMLVD